MARKLSRVTEVKAASSVFRHKANQLPHLFAACLWQGLKRISLRANSKSSKRFTHRSSAMDARGKADFLSSTGQQDQATAPLGHTVVGRVEHGMSTSIAQTFQFLDDSVNALVSRQTRNVFHHHCFGTQATDKSHQLKDQIVARVDWRVAPIQRPHHGEALARRAARKEIELAAPEFEATHHLSYRKPTNVLPPNNDAFVIRFVGLDCEGVVLDGANDSEASLFQPLRQAPATGKQVYGGWFPH